MIFQFSPIRTGSTLVYNILKQIFNVPIIKEHKYSNRKNVYYITTIRHPYNSIISSIMRYNEEINKKTLEKAINEYLEYGGLYLITNEFINNNKILILKYEDFNNNNIYIINKLCEFFHFKIKKEYAEKIINNFSKDIVLDKISGFKDFNEYCEDTHLHGNHINKYKGNTDYKKILSPELIDILNKNIDLQKIINHYY